ncbi:sigma-70 family RNA polymerase sigma factor [bacterium]|nr:sigma-70 family RNA polymerase sigma factor [bacterium]
MATTLSESSGGCEHLSEGDFMRLLMQHEPALRAFARALLPNWHLVDEVIQEASITLWDKFSQLRDEEGFLPWAKVVVRFKCLSAISKMQRYRHVFSDGVLEILADEAEAIDVEEQAAARMALRTCLDRFSEPHQELLLAPYSGDGHVKSIAEESGKSANALYKLLGRLREKLFVCIHKNLKPQTC